MPVIFGPQHANSRDADLLLRDAAARSVTDRASLQETLAHWLDPADAHVRREAGTRAMARVQLGLGAADRATALVLSLLPQPRQ